MSRSYKKRPYYTSSEWNKGYKRSYNKSLRKRLKQDINAKILKPLEYEKFNETYVFELDETDFEKTGTN
jgi:hypothetical protein